MVSPLPLSLATTRGISVDFFSSPYLDVSVREVPHAHLCIQCTFHDSSSWGFPQSEIHGYNAYLQLPVAYRSLSRPSSAPDAKASALCSFSLELSLMNLANSSYLVLWIAWVSSKHLGLLLNLVKRFYPYYWFLTFHLREIVLITLLLERPILISF